MYNPEVLLFKNKSNLQQKIQMLVETEPENDTESALFHNYLRDVLKVVDKNNNYYKQIATIERGGGITKLLTESKDYFGKFINELKDSKDIHINSGNFESKVDEINNVSKKYFAKMKAQYENLSNDEAKKKMIFRAQENERVIDEVSKVIKKQKHIVEFFQNESFYRREITTHQNSAVLFNQTSILLVGLLMVLIGICLLCYTISKFFKDVTSDVYKKYFKDNFADTIINSAPAQFIKNMVVSLVNHLLDFIENNKGNILLLVSAIFLIWIGSYLTLFGFMNLRSHAIENPIVFDMGIWKFVLGLYLLGKPL